VKVVAGASLDADDCRTLLSILGLDREIVASARGQVRPAAKRARKRRAAA
jgi:hypothetical protein